MTTRRAVVRTALTNAVGLVGAGVLAAGVGMVFLPAGVMVAGLGLLALAWRMQS